MTVDLHTKSPKTKEISVFNVNHEIKNSTKRIKASEFNQQKIHNSLIREK